MSPQLRAANAVKFCADAWRRPDALFLAKMRTHANPVGPCMVSASMRERLRVRKFDHTIFESGDLIICQQSSWWSAPVLPGIFCRYDGGSKPHPKIVKLCRLGFCVPVCPEKALHGLPTPRPPCEQLDGQIICKTARMLPGNFWLVRKGFADSPAILLRQSHPSKAVRHPAESGAGFMTAASTGSCRKWNRHLCRHAQRRFSFELLYRGKYPGWLSAIIAPLITRRFFSFRFLMDVSVYIRNMFGYKLKDTSLKSGFIVEPQ